MDELTDAALFRLTCQALLTYLGPAENFEFTMQAGCASALSGAPVADLNYVVAGPGASDGRRFATRTIAKVWASGETHQA